MNCQQIQAQFDERLDGRLAAELAAAFDGHVAACSDCRPQWQAYAAAWETVGCQPAVTPSFGFAARTLRRLAATPVKECPWFWRPAWRWAWLGMALCGVGVAGWQGHQRIAVARQVAAYADAQQQDFLEDYDVIASLDQLDGQNRL